MTLVYLERPNGLGNPAGVPRPPRAVADAPQSERERLSSWWEMYWHQQQVIYTDQSVPAFAVAPDLLLTAASNLHGNAKHGTAQLPEGGIACSVIAIDSPRDLALLRCERPHNLAIATLSATAPQLGSRVALLSRHQSEIGWTATLGTISATNRRRVQSRLSFLQTDARANYGSLGGALIDDMGFVVGMCVKLGPSSDQPWLINSGVALATGSIGINEALSVLREGRSTDTPPIIGMGIVPRERNRRLYIDHVTANTGAEAAGLVIGDELLRVDGVNVFSRDSLSRMLLRKKSGDIIAVELRRGEQTITVNVELREFTP